MEGGRRQPGLLVCPTPIGNLDDVTLRVLSALAGADVVACEDTRHTRALLRRHGISPKGLVSFHEHNETRRTPELMARMRSGEVVALVSDAGTPLVSDPGYVLVRRCLQEGLRVEALPGPSAVTTALVAAGLPAASFRFVGFLPRARGQLRAVLDGARETLVAFESPRRLAATLALLAELDPERPLAVCRELTKLHEEVRRGAARELAAHYAAHEARGEVVLVCGAAAEGASAAGREAAVRAVRELIEAGAKPRRAAATVARLSGIAANELYRQAADGRRSPARQ